MDTKKNISNAFIYNICFRDLKKQGGTQYLVKWKELGYDAATWEFKDDEDNKDIPYVDCYIFKQSERCLF